MKREAVMHISNYFGASERKSCQLVQINRTTYRYKRKPKNDNLIKEKIEKILENNSMYGLSMIHLKLRQDKILINHKRTERIYKEMDLALKQRKRRKKVTSEERTTVEHSEKPGKVWAMDFIHDSVAEGKRLKVLTVIDPATNVSPVLEAAFSMSGKDVSEVLDRICENAKFPEYLKCDNGPEFRSKELDQWCYKNNVKIIFSRPGKPTDNCHIESFNGTFRNECLNSHYFKNLTEARDLINSWWIEYNERRPQKRLKGMTPREYECKLNTLKTNSEGGPNSG